MDRTQINIEGHLSTAEPNLFMDSLNELIMQPIAA